MHSICSVHDGNSQFVILFLISTVSVSLNRQRLRRAEWDTSMGDRKSVQPDPRSFACLCLVCHLESEQQFLVCSLGHLTAEVIRPVVIAALHFENLENVI